METLVTKIQKNIENVTGRINCAANSAGRDGRKVQLIVVSKGQPLEVIKAAIAAGVQCFGENYPEEAVPKITALEKPSEVKWHMIGHLQRRKSHLVVDYFDYFQSLDSLKLGKRLSAQLNEKNKILPVMLEFNVGGEESKFGWPAWDEKNWHTLLPEIEQILGLNGLDITGIMTMPPYFDDPELSRPYFKRLQKLGNYLQSHFDQQHFGKLSMGTSMDFEVAVQEGADMVRIGQAILGPRPVAR